MALAGCILHFLLSSIILGSFCAGVSGVDESGSRCANLRTCAECIGAPDCGWCSQGFDGAQCIGVQNDEQVGAFQCTGEVFFPSNQMDVKQDKELSQAGSSSSIHIKPQEVTLQLRRGVPLEIFVEYKEPGNYPLDLYYLMDFTLSMKDDKEVLANLGEQLGAEMQELTSQYRQGFGTFIDKVALPYVRMTPPWLENPCRGGTRNENCTTPYGFKHHHSLSSDWITFSEKIKQERLSGSVDNPEGGLEALMQVMVCGEEIGWRKDSRKVVVVATDNRFHIAGDGKLGGIIRRNDERCHLNRNGEYTQSTEIDYPSVAQVNHQAILNDVIVVFAVTEPNFKIYEELGRRIEGAKSAVLSSNSSNVVQLVIEEYKKITSTIEMSDNFPKQYLNVEYFSTCGSQEETKTDKCVDVPVGSSVGFKVKVDLLQCPDPDKKDEWNRTFEIYRVGLKQNTLKVNVEMLCDCPCENEENWDVDSEYCGHRGIEKCGLCLCQDGYFGKQCQCNAKGRDVPKDEIKDCTAENATDPCSGRGECNCGQCECEIRSNPYEKYYGKFCECDNFSCDKYQGEICGGHGLCECGSCFCKSGWKGTACECATDIGLCVKPGMDDVCSGNGECICGACKCEGKHSGKYCEKCLHETCPTKCEELSPCVQCTVHKTGQYGAEDCDRICNMTKISVSDVFSQDSSSEDEIFCRAVDSTDECSFFFVYNYEDHNMIDAQRSKECPPTPPIFWIIGAVVLVVVIVGLCLIVAYKVYMHVADSREYARFVKAQEQEGLKNTENPLYETPIGHYQNPMYGKK